MTEALRAIAQADALDPRVDAAKIEETAHRLVNGLHQKVANREERVRETSDLMAHVAARFDAYDEALAGARQAKDAADERVRELEAEAEVVKAAHAEALADAARREQVALRDAEERARVEIERIRDGVDRLKEEMGRRFLKMEEDNGVLEAELSRQSDENVSLNRSMQMLIGAVEASARSLQAEDVALEQVIVSVRERAAYVSDLPPGVVRLPVRRTDNETLSVEYLPAQSRTAG